MILHFNVPFEPLNGLVETNTDTFNEYFFCKSCLIYLCCFPLFIISITFFIPFIIFYGIFRGIYYFQDEDADNLFDIVFDINNLFLKIVAGIFLFPIQIIFYIISLATSLELYILSWILGLISFCFTYPLYKILDIRYTKKLIRSNKQQRVLLSTEYLGSKTYNNDVEMQIHPRNTDFDDNIDEIDFTENDLYDDF